MVNKTTELMANYIDRIIKENINGLFSFFSTRQGIDVKESEEIKDKLQVTLERESDFLKRILHEDSAKDFILHFEFQVEDEILIMIRRFLLYRGILFHKTGLSVKQFVIYLGNKPSKMVSILEQEDLSFRFAIINLCDIPFEEFLDSDNPETIIMAILANFKQQSSDKVIEKVLAKLAETVESRLLLSKYVVQLQVLSNLRNLQSVVNQNIQNMAITADIDLSKDPFFKDAIEKGLKQGLEQGLEQGLKQSIIRLLKSKALSHQQIAEILDVPFSLVVDLQKQLDTQPKNGKKKK
jgi:hypothetical protein